MNSNDSRPARSCGAAAGTTVLMPPWNPLPNPIPLTAVPAKNSAADPLPSAMSVMATPVHQGGDAAMSITAPRRGAAQQVG